MFDHHHRHDHHYHGDPQVEVRLRALEQKADLIIERIAQMAKTLDEILAQGQTVLDQVTKNTDLDNSIIALVNANTATIKDLRAQLATAGTDPAKLAALGDLMDKLGSGALTQGKSVADAVTANTGA